MSLARGIARAGLRHEPVGAAPDAEIARAFAPVWAREASTAHVIGDLFAGMHARAALPDMLALVDAWKPDVVVRETMEFASTLAAERHGVPQVRFGVHLQAAVDGERRAARRSRRGRWTRCGRSPGSIPTRSCA